MHLVVLHFHQIARNTHCGNFAECALTDALFHHISCRHGTTNGKAIGSWLPREQETIVTTLGERHRAHWQGLHSEFAAIATSNKLKHTLIYRTAHREAERWVESVFHVSEVVMRQQFEQHSRNLWHSCFVVRLIPHASASPIRLKLRTHIVANVCADGIGEQSRIDARRAVGIIAKFVRHIDAQCAYDAIICGISGIRVKCKSNIHWDIQTLCLWQHLRTTGYPIHPHTAAAIIVVVIIEQMRLCIYRIWHASPLHPVSRTLGETRMTAQLIAIVNALIIFIAHIIGFGGTLHTAGNIAHTTAHLHGIGGDNALAFRQVAERNQIFIFTFSQWECA